MGNILSIGSDVALLLSRDMLLRSTGAATTSEAFEPAIELLRWHYYDVVVLCHTLSPQETGAACSLVQLFWPVSKLLLIRDGWNVQPPDCQADSVLQEAGEPAALCALIADMIRHCRSQAFAATPGATLARARLRRAPHVTVQ